MGLLWRGCLGAAGSDHRRPGTAKPAETGIPEDLRRMCCSSLAGRRSSDLVRFRRGRSLSALLLLCASCVEEVGTERGRQHASMESERISGGVPPQGRSVGRRRRRSRVRPTRTFGWGRPRGRAGGLPRWRPIRMAQPVRLSGLELLDNLLQGLHILRQDHWPGRVSSRLQLRPDIELGNENHENSCSYCSLCIAPVWLRVRRRTNGGTQCRG